MLELAYTVKELTAISAELIKTANKDLYIAKHHKELHYIGQEIQKRAGRGYYFVTIPTAELAVFGKENWNKRFTLEIAEVLHWYCYEVEYVDKSEGFTLQEESITVRW